MPKFFVVVAALLAASGARAQSDSAPLVTDRPDFTESASTVAPGRVQVEAGSTFTNDDRVETLEVGEALVRIGLVSGLELRIAPGSLVTVDAPGFDETGLDDASVGVKTILAEAAPGRPAAALLAATSLPTGDDTIGTDGWQPEAILALAWDLSPSIGLGVNAGYTWADAGDDRFHQGSASVALGLPAGERLGVFLELFGFIAEDPGSNEASFDGGLTYALDPDLQFDARVGVGLTDHAPDAFLGAGVSHRW